MYFRDFFHGDRLKAITGSLKDERFRQWMTFRVLISWSIFQSIPESTHCKTRRVADLQSLTALVKNTGKFAVIIRIALEAMLTR
jgi:hypothetical protein